MFQIHEVTRNSGTTVVTLAYSVEKAGNVLTSDDAIETLDVLDVQELAIILQQVVATKIEREYIINYVRYIQHSH